MARKDGRPAFTPDLSDATHLPVAEQEANHNAYWDRKHDIDLAQKLKNTMARKGLEVHSDRGDTTRLIIEVVRELRLTQE